MHITLRTMRQSAIRAVPETGKAANLAKQKQQKLKKTKIKCKGKLLEFVGDFKSTFLLIALIIVLFIGNKR